MEVNSSIYILYKSLNSAFLVRGLRPKYILIEKDFTTRSYGKDLDKPARLRPTEQLTELLV